MDKIQMQLKQLLYFIMGILLVSCNSEIRTNSAGQPAPKLDFQAPSSLNILIIGGTNGIGLQTVKLALDRGHTVTAVARRPERMTLSHERLKTIEGNILSPASLKSTMAGSDAVVIAIGISPTREPVSVFSEGTANTLNAMQKNGLQRIIAVTGIGAGDSRGHGGFFYDNILQPLLLNTIYEDKDRAEKLINASESEWTIVRPGILNDEISTKKYRIISDMQGITSGEISRADTAHFILSALETNNYISSTVLLTN
jgi:putative NADH-flavin reductase